MIGKLKYLWNTLFKRNNTEIRYGGSKRSGYASDHVDTTPMRLQPHKYRDPLYPPDLAEAFPENRTETHSDTCFWQELRTDNKE